MKRLVPVTCYQDVEVDTGLMTVNVKVEGEPIELYAEEARELIDAIEAALADMGRSREPKAQTVVVNEVRGLDREQVLGLIAEVAYDAWCQTSDGGQERTYMGLREAALEA